VRSYFPNAGAGEFANATALVVNGTDIEDGIAIDSAVGKEPRRRALDVDAVEYVDVANQVVGYAGIVSPIDKDAALGAGDNVVVNYRSQQPLA
jgi:hypothetical protein